MTALAYLAPPISGFIAYLKGRDRRTRMHGLQSVLLGVAWPAALYVGSWMTPAVTQAAFFAGAGAWLMLLAATALGRDPFVPGGRSALERWAEVSPLDRTDL